MVLQSCILYPNLHMPVPIGNTFYFKNWFFWWRSFRNSACFFQSSVFYYRYFSYCILTIILFDSRDHSQFWMTITSGQYTYFKAIEFRCIIQPLYCNIIAGLNFFLNYFFPANIDFSANLNRVLFSFFYTVLI